MQGSGAKGQGAGGVLIHPHALSGESRNFHKAQYPLKDQVRHIQLGQLMMEELWSDGVKLSD